MRSPMLNVLSPDECLHLLGTVKIGRVGLSIDALPAILPVNFCLLDRDIVLRTVEGTKFHAAASATVLAFEADGYELDGTTGWSVLVQGVSRVVDEPLELLRVGELNLESWALDGAADHFVRITSSRVSGRRFSRGPSIPDADVRSSE
jgi:nitroimidazol reductase NimA-like FMN-containing flavoprotein (pyridoxamine 5'-phosphate oxidase superfamily)